MADALSELVFDTLYKDVKYRAVTMYESQDASYSVVQKVPSWAGEKVQFIGMKSVKEDVMTPNGLMQGAQLNISAPLDAKDLLEAFQKAPAAFDDEVAKFRQKQRVIQLATQMPPELKVVGK